MANSPARTILDVGSVIADTYTIEARIGVGGMGEVFLASHQRLPGKKVAIKLLHAGMQDAEVLTRFRHEAEIASRLGHPNIVAVHDFNVTGDGTPYLVLEYLCGETLDHRIVGGPMPIVHVLSIVRQVGSALAAAHREGIVHRDLKPQNIFLVPTEVDGRVVEIAKVLDFGISKIRGSLTVKTQDSMLLGTPQYMAPEQARGEQFAIDERTDVFAFGSIVYEMLSGRPAFSGASIPEVVFKVVYDTPPPLAERSPNTPREIVAAVERAMAKAPADRFPTASAFVEAVTGQPVSEFRVPTAPNVGLAVGSRVRSSGQLPVRDDDAFAHTSALHSDIQGRTTQDSGPPPIAHDRPARVSEAPTVARKPRARSRLPFVLVAGAGAAGAAVVMYFAIGASEPAGDAPVPGVIAAQPPSVVIQDARVDRVPDDVAHPIDAGRAPVVRATKPPSHAPTVAAEPTPPEPPGDATTTANLVAAEAALAAHDFDRAERLANGVINADANTNAHQAARAHAVRGAVRCAARNNEEGAQIDLRAIGNHALRRRLLAICHEHGFLESQRQ